jgi:hypothetical protein
MNPKKPEHLKSRHAGISLEPGLIKAVRKKARDEGFRSLSAYVRFLLTAELKKSAQAIEQAGHAEIKKAQGKLRRR